MSLNQAIKNFYDQSTPLWLSVWGEHMHHGFYENGERGEKSHTIAQLDLVDEMLRWGKVNQAKEILDAGCGVGGSARLLAQKFDAKVLGLTLSPVQAAEGQAYTKAMKLENQVRIETRDMMSLRGGEQKYDLIWSMESAEHIADKQAMIEMFYQLLKPGGKLLMATWCHREAPPELNNQEQNLLQKIYRWYHLPPMVAMSTLEASLQSSGFREVQSADWSDNVAPFWKAVIRSVFSFKSIRGLLKAGLPTIRGAWAMRYMTRGYRQEIIKFGVFQGTK